MIEQRPYVNEGSLYLYNLYDTSLRNEAQDVNDLKLNIEKSYLELASIVPKQSKLLSIEEFEKLIKRQKMLTGYKLEVIKKIGINNGLLETLRLNGKSDSLILRSLSILETLNTKLIDVDNELTGIIEKILAHYFKIAALGSVQALVASPISRAKNPSQNSHDDSTTLEFVGSSYLDELVSHVASVLVQKNISLPTPSNEDISTEGKVTWVKSCIDRILNNEDYSASTPISTSKQMAASSLKPGTSPSMNDSKEIIGLKTALKDLQFAHQYLTKQYEEERSVNTQTMNSLRLKLQNSQELLMKTNKELSRQTQNLINLELQLNNSDLQNSAKTQEISELNKKINLLTIDHLGENSPKLLSPPTSSKDDELVNSSAAIPLSPVTGVGFISNDSGSDGGSRPGSNEFSGNDTMKSSISNSILRLEFKKLLNDINSKHEQELQKEQNERKKLENLIKMMNNKQ